MQTRDIVAIGASAGGVEALRELVRHLPVDFPAVIFVVLHVPDLSTSVLPHILARAGELPVAHPEDGQKVIPGHIYVAPPGFHLGVSDGRIALSRGPRENNVRPSIDYLFRSVAQTYGPRVIGVELSGLLFDGAAGLKAIKQHGGLAVVQDPEDAIFSSMPLSALRQVNADAVLPVSGIARYLSQQVGAPVEPEGVQGMNQDMEDDSSRLEKKIEKDLDFIRDGKGKALPILVTCPECGGILWELRDGELVEYECYIGHRYQGASLLTAKNDELENALWWAVRILEERANLSNRLASQSQGLGSDYSSNRFIEQAEQARHAADIIRELIDSTRLDTEGGIGDQESS